MNNVVTIGPISASIRRGVSRVEATVEGEPLWFESGDAALIPSPEAFGSALLLPALYGGRTLTIHDAVCPQWHRHLPQIASLLHRWWNYPQKIPQTQTRKQADSRPATSVGLLFTGGADSFFSLLHSHRRIDQLIYVLDYDVPPHAPQRFSNFEPHLRQIAAESGAGAILVRSNLRRHSAFRGPSWQETHGAALIAVGHLLRDSIGTLLVSSSHPRSSPENWGTHWDLDPLWSSSQLSVVHFGAEIRRSEKIRALVGNSLVQRFLRPCWENLPNGLNCSVCEKCVRTQLVVSRWGDLSKFTAFDQSESLARKLGNLRRVPRANRLLSYSDCVHAPLPIDIHDALVALIRRSRRYLLRKKIQAVAGQVLWPWGGQRKPRAA